MEPCNYVRYEDSTAVLLMIQVFWDVMLYRWVSHDILKALCSCEGAHGGIVVKALCYKPTGRGFDS